MDHYDALGVARDASQADIKKAYRRAASQHHPDRGGSKERMAAANDAFACLSDPERRARYDAGEGDQPQGPTVEERAQRMLHEVLQHAFRHMLGGNPIDVAKQCAAHSQSEGASKVEQLRNQVKQLQHHRTRIKVKGNDRAAYDVIDSMVQIAEREIEAITDLLAVVKLTIELLAVYDYDMPPAPKVPKHQQELHDALMGVFGAAPPRRFWP